MAILTDCTPIPASANQEGAKPQTNLSASSFSESYTNAPRNYKAPYSADFSSLTASNISSAQALKDLYQLRHKLSEEIYLSEQKTNSVDLSKRNALLDTLISTIKDNQSLRDLIAQTPYTARDFSRGLSGPEKLRMHKAIFGSEVVDLVTSGFAIIDRTAKVAASTKEITPEDYREILPRAYPKVFKLFSGKDLKNVKAAWDTMAGEYPSVSKDGQLQDWNYIGFDRMQKEAR